MTPSDHILQGPFHTRDEAARLAGVSAAELAAMAGTISIDGPLSLEEVYPAFQFAPSGGFVTGLTEVVVALGTPGRAAAEWLIAPQQALGARSPLEWLSEGRAVAPVLALIGD